MTTKKYEITGKTKLTALLGSPISHSISPQMHNEAFKILGLDYAYLAFDVTKSTLHDAILGLRAIHVVGFNVTMPLKSDIFHYVDELTPQARLSGAVNTVYYKNGKMMGHTTDGIGYFNSLKEENINPKGKKMTILGFGGAAKSICVQAAIDGISSIDIFKRNLSEKNNAYYEALSFCDELADETNCIINLFDINDDERLKSSLKESYILTNATNVGMEPDIDKCIIKDSSFFHPELIVSDIIYNPKETALLKMANAVGCTCMNGLNMLLYQGAESFYCFTGQQMPVKKIKDQYFS